MYRMGVPQTMIAYLVRGTTRCTAAVYLRGMFSCLVLQHNYCVSDDAAVPYAVLQCNFCPAHVQYYHAHRPLLALRARCVPDATPLHTAGAIAPSVRVRASPQGSGRAWSAAGRRLQQPFPQRISTREGLAQVTVLFMCCVRWTCLLSSKGSEFR